MQICPSCKAENEDNAKYCESCGTKLPEVSLEETANDGKVCHSCGMLNESNARFCEKCGARLVEDIGNSSLKKGEVCPLCGAVNEEGSKFCEECGTYLDVTKADEETEEKKIQNAPMPRPVKKLTKLQKILVAEVVCLAVLVMLFFFIGHSKYSDESVAEAYFEAYASQDWQTVYSLLDVSSGELLQESRFEELMQDARIPEIVDFTVKKSAPPEMTESGTVQDFEVSYETADGETERMSFSVVNENAKKWFLFDEWYVSSSAVTDRFQITLPQSAQVTIDGVALDSDDLMDTAMEGIDIYEVTLFNGNHEISVAVPWCEIYTTDIDTTKDNSLMVSEFSLTEEGEAALEAKLQTALEQMYTAAMSGEDFDAVEALFVSGADNDCEEEYETLSEHLNDGDYTLNQISFDSFDCEFDFASGSISCMMDCETNYNYTYTGSNEPRTDDGTAHINAVAIYEDGTYKLSDIDLPIIP